jgi:hypothetical protein
LVVGRLAYLLQQPHHAGSQSGDHLSSLDPHGYSRAKRSAASDKALQVAEEVQANARSLEEAEMEIQGVEDRVDEAERAIAEVGSVRRVGVNGRGGRLWCSWLARATQPPGGLYSEGTWTTY